ncbi:SGNH/GDSL hydrolase family protein [Streptomyces sp. BH-SS-21]|uniref:SGNH/GDSL hydrolase family protein n=1 Tax=Streptomyces liliiviolaceus TaxID=2823109 RepID=A0A941B897_9ACTN|nr:SGNH/GDSL hydrolase family protein [Streptomyces liliiviolaceus]MBQ0850632.1 SGNH/GDSL hydrolase family protein [Streptomyces liliiviolaceus]
MARFRTRLALLGSAAAFAAGALAPAQLVGAQPAAAADYDWVALGDSYTAGVIPAAGDIFEIPRDGCERTDRSYPQVIDRDLGSFFELTNVSCGAATIEDVTFNAQQPIGRSMPGQPDPDAPFPPVPPQSDAVKSGTDVITVGVGGNTLGFGEILFKCLQLGEGSGGVGTPCKDELAADIPARLTKVSTDYDQMLAKLHEKGPHAKILAVGYPTVIPEDTSKCRYNDIHQFFSITPGDLDWLRQDVLEPLNKVIEKSAGTQDSATFVDLYNSSAQHSVCDAGEWVEGILDSDNRPALVHPNAKGHLNAADHVTSAMLNAIAP